MFLTLLKKEILTSIKTYKFMFSILMATVLFSVSLYVMYEHYKIKVENYTILKPKDNEPKVLMPPNPLSMFSKGREEALGNMFYSHEGSELLYLQSNHLNFVGNQTFAFFPTPDLLYIIKIIFSLIAIIFSFNVINEEKQNSTLKIVSSYRVQKISFLMSKFLAGLLTLVIPFIILFILSIVVLQTFGNISFSHEEYGKLSYYLFLEVKPK